MMPRFRDIVFGSLVYGLTTKSKLQGPELATRSTLQGATGSNSECSEHVNTHDPD